MLIKDLKNKIEDHSTQLAEIETQKVDKNGSGQVTYAMLSQDAREQITGGNTAVVGVDSVLPTNITYGGVIPENTAFIIIGKNKINKNQPLYTGYYVGSDGSIAVQSLFDISNWVQLKVGTTYTVSTDSNTFMYISFYSKRDTGSFVSRVNTSTLNPINSYTFTATQPYCLVSYQKAIIGYLQLEEGSSRTTYETFKYTLNSNIGIDSITNIQQQVDSLSNKDYSIFGSYPYIKNGELTLNKYLATGSTNRATYICADLGENAVTVKAKCKFFGANNSTVAVISEPTAMVRTVSDVTLKSIHVTFNSVGSCSVGVFNNQVLTNVQTLSFPALNTDGSTEYELGWSLNGDVLTVYFPNGTTQTVTSTLFAGANGRYIIWEHFIGTVQEVFNHSTFTEFYAIGVSGKPINDNFKRFDGQIGISNSGHTYALAHQPV